MPEKVLVTGSRGFIGKNLVVRLGELGRGVVTFDRADPVGSLPERLQDVGAVVHLAGENRPADVAEFAAGNAALTQSLCDAIAATGRRIPLVITSSRHAATHDAAGISEFHRAYGRSKHDAERAVEALATKTGSPVVIYRLPGVFGKWCRPNYNSVVATFCHNVAHGLPLKVNDPNAPLQLVYVDDVVREILRVVDTPGDGITRGEVAPEYTVTLGALASLVESFRGSRDSLVVERVGSGLTRALYATYVSYLPPASFAYAVPKHGDERGMFAELLKTADSGQFSFFTAHPGITRGGHYHHTKTEKFVVVKGKARFGFRHILTGERHEIETTGDTPTVVETVPGWAHDITNIGTDEMVVLLWANEIFDRQAPDTIMAPVQ
jgi:UDP-2-acetamido-2,6-beta-L-arabino-hexul-4-ose reductase